METKVSTLRGLAQLADLRGALCVPTFNFTVAFDILTQSERVTRIHPTILPLTSQQTFQRFVLRASRPLHTHCIALVSCTRWHRYYALSTATCTGLLAQYPATITVRDQSCVLTSSPLLRPSSFRVVLRCFPLTMSKFIVSPQWRA